MVYMLFDSPCGKEDMSFFKDGEFCNNIKQVYPPQKCNSTKEMLVACKNCINQSAQGDTIICWYDFMGILCWWLCKLHRYNRKIIILNILLKDKNTIKNKVAKFLYKPALKSKTVQATVTSKKYGEYLNKMLRLNNDYVLLHDIYRNEYNINYSGQMISNSVFCGGRNGRDWEFLITLANEMPDVQFNCVMQKDKYEQFKDHFGKNIKVKYDIPEKEFLEFMCQSQLVVMPLDTEAPAGLIVLFQAAANDKMVITSNTVTTEEYFVKDRGELCGHKTEEWKLKIRHYLQHKNEAQNCAVSFRTFLENECSEEEYLRILMKMLVK